ncbi:MAG: hypothetical protein EOO77_24210 [Oxalobacteraceae bacterium]|nr:MAG: hypothetical protein EOO77_24210 [Oxalobacteraceae bacterium]
MSYAHFIGLNWFDHHPKINEHAKRHGHTTSLKVHGDVVEGTRIPLKDFADICSLENRVTVTIEPKGKILSIKLA